MFSQSTATSGRVKARLEDVAFGMQILHEAMLVLRKGTVFK